MLAGDYKVLLAIVKANKPPSPLTTTRYSASALERDTAFCRLEYQETSLSPKNIVYPEVDLRVSRQSTQLAFLYLSKAEIVDRRKRRQQPSVPCRYSRMCLVAERLTLGTRIMLALTHPPGNIRDIKAEWRWDTAMHQTIVLHWVTDRCTVCRGDLDISIDGCVARFAVGHANSLNYIVLLLWKKMVFRTLLNSQT